MRAWYFTFIWLPQQLIAVPFSQCPKICAWVHSQFHYPAYTVNFIIQHTQSISLSSIHSQFNCPAYTVNFIIQHTQSISLSSIHITKGFNLYYRTVYGSARLLKIYRRGRWSLQLQTHTLCLRRIRLTLYCFVMQNYHDPTTHRLYGYICANVMGNYLLSSYRLKYKQIHE